MQPTTKTPPPVSVIIPVKNGGQTLEACLRALKRSYYKLAEIIVVDDHSTDGTAEIVRRHGCTLLTVVDGRGANYARNFGARHAGGEILFFLDADILVRRDTVLIAVESLEEEWIDAIVGLYTARHRHENFVSQYKNLWVRYSYLKSSAAIDWLFGAISGIKRSAFEKLGGFDVGLNNQQGTEDIELGKRFAQANMNVVLDIDVEVEHLKNYTLGSFIRNEFTRSMGFAELATQLGQTVSSVGRGFANVYPSFVVSTIISFVLLVIIGATMMGMVPAWSLVVALVIYVGMNIRFLNYLEQVRGLFAMMAMVPFLFIDHLVCFAGSVVGILKGLFGSKSAQGRSI